MNICDLLHDDLVVTDLKSGSKENVLLQMLETLAATGRIRNRDEMLRLLLERERLMSTGIGRGFAIPHAFSDEVSESFIIIGKAAEGMDFEALDHQPVFYLFLLLGPPDSQTLHLRTLSRLSRIISSFDVVEQLSGCKTSKDMISVLCDLENRVRLDRPFSFDSGKA